MINDILRLCVGRSIQIDDVNTNKSFIAEIDNFRKEDKEHFLEGYIDIKIGGVSGRYYEEDISDYEHSSTSLIIMVYEIK
jgi:hypothetical protein